MSIKMRYRGVGNYNPGPGGIEQPGDFAWKIENSREQVDGIWRDKPGDIYIVLHCPRYLTCNILVRQGKEGTHGEDGKQRWWAWDGNFESPTITPSIGCDHEKRCGQHMVIANGHVTGTCTWTKKKPKE